MRGTDEKTLAAKAKREVIITSHLTTHFLRLSLMTSTYTTPIFNRKRDVVIVCVSRHVCFLFVFTEYL